MKVVMIMSHSHIKRNRGYMLIKSKTYYYALYLVNFCAITFKESQF